jgi:hypothetical protein
MCCPRSMRSSHVFGGTSPAGPLPATSHARQEPQDWPAAHTSAPPAPRPSPARPSGGAISNKRNRGVRSTHSQSYKLSRFANMTSKIARLLTACRRRRSNLQQLRSPIALRSRGSAALLSDRSYEGHACIVQAAALTAEDGDTALEVALVERESSKGLAGKLLIDCVQGQKRKMIAACEERLEERYGAANGNLVLQLQTRWFENMLKRGITPSGRRRDPGIKSKIGRQNRIS